MKYYFFLLISFFSLYMMLSTSAKAVDEHMVDVDQRIDVDNKGNGVFTYDLLIKNNSKEKLISGLNLSFPYENSQVIFVSGTKKYDFSNRNINLDLLENPIPTSSNREVVIKVRTTGLVDSMGNFKRFYLEDFQSSIPISSYKMSINYPQGWGNLTYSSYAVQNNSNNLVVANDNKSYYFVWGKSAEVNLSSNLTIEGNSLVPLIHSSEFQEVNFISIQPEGKIFFDKDDNAYLVNDRDADVIIHSRLKINSEISPNDSNKNLNTENRSFHFPELGETNSKYETTKAIADYLKAHYKIGERENIGDSIKKMSGDEFNLELITLLWMREKGINAYVSAGWDLSLLDSDNNYDYWINWFDDEVWRTFDVYGYIKGKTDSIENHAPEKISLIDLKSTDLDSITRYEKSLSNNFFPEITMSSQMDKEDISDVTFHMVWEHDTALNIIRGHLNVENNTEKLLKINEIVINGQDAKIKEVPEGYIGGLGPNGHAVFEIEYRRKFNQLFSGKEILDTNITYSLDETDGYVTTQNDELDVSVQAGNETLIFLGAAAGICFLGIQIFNMIKKPFYLDRLKTLRYNVRRKK